jgi:Predicted integral membrane protein
MATADLLVMAIYFIMLSAMLSWKRLQDTFPSRRMDVLHDDGTLCQEMTLLRDTTDKRNRRSCLFSGILAACVSLIVAEISIIFEKHTSRFLPGLGCAAVSAMGISMSRVLDSIVRRESKRSTTITKSLSKFKSDLKLIGGLLSQFYFLALFAAIGVSANLSKVVTQGASTFLFAIISLFIHFGTLGVGSFLVMKFLPLIAERTNVIFPLAIEEVLVASNAAIGGASTAAGFAGNINKDRIDSKQKRALTIAATFWGIVGYAFATTVGVSLTKILAVNVMKF